MFHSSPLLCDLVFIDLTIVFEMTMRKCQYLFFWLKKDSYNIIKNLRTKMKKKKKKNQILGRIMRIHPNL
jgi:hypothetical protein